MSELPQMLQLVSIGTPTPGYHQNLLAYALETSLAPLPKAEKVKAMVEIARIQSYLAVIVGAILIQYSSRKHFKD